MRAVAATALVLVAAGCGSSGRHATGPRPTAAKLVRSSLAAAAASPGAQYVLVVDAKLKGTLPKQLQSYVKGDPHARATGTIGRDEFTAQVTSSIPQIALLTGDETRAGPGYAYLRYQGTWYGTAAHGLADFWRRLPSAGFFASAIHGTVVPGPSQDGTDTWELAGRPDPRALAALVRPLLGPMPPASLPKIAARSRALYDVGRDDHLPRRVRLELHILRSDVDRPLARQFPDLHAIDAVVELALSHWGTQRPVDRPTPVHSYREYVRKVRG
jgi:hypothetical protein